MGSTSIACIAFNGHSMQLSSQKIRGWQIEDYKAYSPSPTHPVKAKKTKYNERNRHLVPPALLLHCQHCSFSWPVYDVSWSWQQILLQERYQVRHMRLEPWLRGRGWVQRGAVPQLQVCRLVQICFVFCKGTLVHPSLLMLRHLTFYNLSAHTCTMSWLPLERSRTLTNYTKYFNFTGEPLLQHKTAEGPAVELCSGQRLPRRHLSNLLVQLPQEPLRHDLLSGPGFLCWSQQLCWGTWLWWLWRSSGGDGEKCLLLCPHCFRRRSLRLLQGCQPSSSWASHEFFLWRVGCWKLQRISHVWLPGQSDQWLRSLPNQLHLLEPDNLSGWEICFPQPQHHSLQRSCSTWGAGLWLPAVQTCLQWVPACVRLWSACQLGKCYE